MFGAMSEARAKCGHFVVWDTKAPQTTTWNVRWVEGFDCLACQLEKEKEAFAKFRLFYERELLRT